MSQRRTGHEQFRNLFKKQSKEQTGVRIEGSNQSSRTRSPATSKASSGSGQQSRHGKGGAPSQSSKSAKKKSGGRKLLDILLKSKNRGKDKPDKSSGKTSGKRKKGTKQAASNDKSAVSKRRPSKTPTRTPQATTPSTPTAKTAGPVPESPKRKMPSTGAPQTTNYKGEEVQEKTLMQPHTVFENDVPMGQKTPGGAGGGTPIKMAETRIKERKLQWKKEEPVKTDPPRSVTPRSDTPLTDPTRMEPPRMDPPRTQVHSAPRTDPKVPESSGSHNAPDDEFKGVVRHEVNNSIKERTIFENDDGLPAEVKEEDVKLQWIPGAQPPAECMSEPAVRKKKSGDEPMQLAAISDRPPRSPVKSPRCVTAKLTKRTPVKDNSPAAVSIASSPMGRPLMLPPSDGQSTIANSTTGSVEPKEEPKEDEAPVSCYFSTTMQQATFTSTETKKGSEGGAVDSESYETEPRQK